MPKKSGSKRTSSSPAKKTAKKAAKKTAKKAVKKVARKASRPAKKTATKASGASARKPTRSRRAKTPLKKAVLEKFRQLLLEKRRGLIGDMSGIEAEAFSGGYNGSGDLSNMPTHLADLGTDNYEHEFSLGLLESERILLNEIDEALARIDDRTYGICVGTGKPIGKARLEARPWAKYCIDYARRIEQGLVRPGEEEEELDE